MKRGRERKLFAINQEIPNWKKAEGIEKNLFDYFSSMEKLSDKGNESKIYQQHERAAQDPRRDLFR